MPSKNSLRTDAQIQRSAKNKGRYSQNVGDKVRPKFYNLFQ